MVGTAEGVLSIGGGLHLWAIRARSGLPCVHKLPSTDLNLWDLKYEWRTLYKTQEAVAEDSGAICKGGTTQTRGYCSPSVREKEEASSKDWHMNWADNLSILDDPGYQAECDGEDEENVDAEAGKTEDEEKEWQKVKERPRHEEVPEWDCMVFDRERNILVTKELVYGSRSDEMDNNPFGDIPGLSVDESDALPRRKKKGGNKSEYKEGKLAEMVFDCERNLWVKRKSLDGSRSNETDEDRFAANPNLSVAETDEGFEIVYRY